MGNTKVAQNIKINSWGEVLQVTTLTHKPTGREIVNASKSVQPSATATELEYITKDGVSKKFYFADEVVKLDREGLRLKAQAQNDLWARFKRHEISADDLSQALDNLK